MTRYDDSSGVTYIGYPEPDRELQVLSSQKPEPQPEAVAA